MPAHTYVPVRTPPPRYSPNAMLSKPQIPLEDEIFSTSYNTGIPSTAPPSFHSIPPSANPRPSFQLPHRNDENAATVMPREVFERPGNRPTMPASLAGDDPAYSLWAPSTAGSELGRDLEAAREDTVARLMERVEELERRLADVGVTELEKVQRAQHWSRMDYAGMVGAVLFVTWICGLVTLAVAARYRAAGIKE